MVQVSNKVFRKNILVLVFLVCSSLLTLSAHAGVSVPIPVFTKQFIPDTIGPGSVSTLTLSIDNSVATEPAEGLAFIDGLPQGMSLATPAFVSNSCAGTLSATNSGTTISFTDGKVGVGQNCQIVVNVTASEPSGEVPYTNTTGDLTSSAGNSGTATATLTVNSGLPGFTKSFAPASVALGGRSTLTFNIDNTLNATRIGNLDFTDNLPTGMIVADPPNVSTDCISASTPDTTTVTANPGSSVIVLDANDFNQLQEFEVLSAGATCTVTVDVIATSGGTLNNVSGDLLADFVIAGKASDILTVTTTPLAIQKSFTDDPVAPGGTVTLDFTLNNFDRLNAATAVAFTDDLADALTGLTFSNLLSTGCSGTVSGVGTTAISFSGGNIAAESSCTISTSLTVPADAIIGAYTNTTSAITGTVDGSSVTGNMAVEDLYVAPTPLLTKEFLEVGTLAPDPTVNAGDDVVLRFTISNPSTTSAATDVEFVDMFSEFAKAVVALPTIPDPACGLGSSVIFQPVSDSSFNNPATLTLTSGSLAAGESCTFDVTLTLPTDLAPGVYTNTTEEPSATIDGATRTGKATSDTLTVIGAPRLTKSFSNDPTAPGGTVTLEFTLTHSADAMSDATAISFTDDLAALNPVLAGLTATGLPLEAACDSDGSGENIGTGTLSGSAGDTLLTLLDAALSPGESCTFSVTFDVPAGAAAGSYTNTTSGVRATVAGLAATSAPASDDLQIAGLTFSKEFVTNPVLPGDTTILRFTIVNLHPTDDATITFFTDDLSSTLSGLAATGPATSDSCGGAITGTTFLVYTGGSVSSGTTCTIEVPVLVPASAANGNYANITSSLVADQGGAITINPAIDTLTVNNNLIQLDKSFTNDPVAPGGSVTLEFVLSNLDTVNAASAIGFSDDLSASLASLTFDSVLSNDCGATVTGTGLSLITVSDASLAAGGSCTISTSLTVLASAVANSYSNTTSDVTATINGSAVIGDPGNDNLEVINLLQFSKSFDGPSTSGGTATLTFTITNPGASTTTGISFSDDLESVLSGLVASSLPAMPCGAGSSITGTSLLSFTGGELPPMGGMCSFDVEVQIPVTESVGDFLNTTSDLLLNGLIVSPPATANLTVEPPPTFSKAFAPATVALNGPNIVTTLTFTIDNTAASTLVAAALDFTDSFPAGVEIAASSNASTTCTGGTLTATSGTGSISYTGGSVAAVASCIVVVDVISITSGDKDNTSGNLTSSSGDSGTAAATLMVDAPPVITAPADVLNFEATGVNSSVPLGTPAITDVVDDDTSLSATPSPDGLSLSLGETVITWTVIDSIGNTSTATQSVTVVDTTPPVIALNDASTISLDFGDTFTDPGATATDIVGGDLTGSISVLGAVGTLPGTYTLIYSVIDASNNPASVSRTVIISAIRSFSDLLPSGETGTLLFISDDPGCTFNTNTEAYIDVSSATITPPSVLSFVDGLITFEIVNCAVGATVNIIMDYGQPLPANATYWKEGTPWYQIPSTINGNTVSFSITDGQTGDTDGFANGTIRDPGGLAILLNSQDIPTLSNWALMILIMLMLGSMTYYHRRRKY